MLQFNDTYNTGGLGWCLRRIKGTNCFEILSILYTLGCEILIAQSTTEGSQQNSQILLLLANIMEPVNIGCLLGNKL